MPEVTVWLSGAAVAAKLRTDWLIGILIGRECRLFFVVFFAQR